MDTKSVFDYIIVGAGSAGCVLANRLTASGRKTALLLEAGGEDKNLWVHIPIGYGKHFTNPEINWLFSSEPGEDWIKRRVVQPRGKIIGGFVAGPSEIIGLPARRRAFALLLAVVFYGAHGPWLICRPQIQPNLTQPNLT